MNKVFDELTHNHPHHAYRETDMNNNDDELRYLENILNEKHSFDTIVVNQIVRSFFWVLNHKLLKVFLLFFLYDLQNIMHVKYFESLNYSNIFDEVELVRLIIVSKIDQLKREQSYSIYNEITSNVILCNFIEVSSWNLFSFNNEVSKEVEDHAQDVRAFY
jgi:hypothetical protein